MKRRSRTLITLFVAVLVAAMALTGCQSAPDITLGMTQIVDHPALNAVREGVVDKLTELGYVEGTDYAIDYQDAQGDPAVGSTIAQSFVSDKVDLILAISTPSAQAAYGAALDADIPVVFSAVTDAVAAGLAAADGSNLPGLTGTSDVMPMVASFDLIQQLCPDAMKVGILHNTSEVNSDVLLALAESVAADRGMQVIDVGITSTNEIATALDTLLPQVDVVLTLTDNMVVSALPLIVQETQEAGIPLFGSEDSQVTAGSLASAGVDYYNLGLQTGAMIAAILDGTAAEDIPIEALTDCTITINTDVATALGITIPDDLMDTAVMVTTDVAE